MNSFTRIVNDALRKRWSTVLGFALILTIGRAYGQWASAGIDWQSYSAQVFFTFIVSFIISLALHVVLFAIFSPKKKEEVVVVPQVSTMSKDEHEAAIKAVNKEFEAVKRADVVAQEKAGTAPVEEKVMKPIDLRKELGMPKARKKKTHATKAKRSAPKKKAAKKKK